MLKSKKLSILVFSTSGHTVHGGGIMLANMKCLNITRLMAREVWGHGPPRKYSKIVQVAEFLSVFYNNCDI